MQKFTQTEINTAVIREKLEQLIGSVTAKSLFYGYGLFKNNCMFGIYQKHFFYIRATGALAKLLLQKGAIPNPYTTPSNQYFYLPDEIINNDDEFRLYLNLSIEQVKQEKQKLIKKRKNQIRDLPNLSIKHERLLAKIGVKNVKEFKKRGPEKIFVELKDMILIESLDLYWKLIGAFYLKHESLLSKSEKEERLKLLNLLLIQAGYPEEPNQ
ncbi:TfoX/Sxy family DNA transformation protein [Gallibacterium trehalosifermentans]|uniref:TfoX/Sxy family DNA transformation protein n=1 Tax=Gallibacterium trehalosifermentans TaxID=516935 RepID=A0ABV6H032_9PAST